MDPNVALANARKAAEDVLGDTQSTAKSVELAESFQALDEWISKGGFFPSKWMGWRR
jgi:hypothetical protein